MLRDTYLGDEVGGGARFHCPHVLAPGTLDYLSQFLLPVFRRGQVLVIDRLIRTDTEVGSARRKRKGKKRLFVSYRCQ